MSLTRITPSTLAISLVIAFAGPVSAQDAGDAEKGEKVFKKCASCHKVGDNAKNGVGPILTNIYGAKAASVEGYKYGKGIKKAGEAGLLWDDETLFEYLENPKKFLRKVNDDKKSKSKMSFKLKKEKQRRNVIAYLKKVAGK